MKVVQGTFNGTGAALYVCCGFIPDKVTVRALEDADCAHIVWARGFRAAEMTAGCLFVTAAGITGDPRTVADTGIAPYEGGDLLTGDNQTSVAYGEGVYLGWDLADYRANSSYGYEDAVIDTWTLGSSANRTGNFNSDVVASGNRIGEGSRILIEESLSGKLREAFIEALTAGQGISANEVTLSRALSSGTVRFIGGMYDMAPIALGKVTPAGFYLSATTGVNVNDEMQWFEAVAYDA